MNEPLTKSDATGAKSIAEEEDARIQMSVRTYTAAFNLLCYIQKEKSVGRARAVEVLRDLHFRLEFHMKKVGETMMPNYQHFVRFNFPEGRRHMDHYTLRQRKAYDRYHEVYIRYFRGEVVELPNRLKRRLSKQCSLCLPEVQTVLKTEAVAHVGDQLTYAGATTGRVSSTERNEAMPPQSQVPEFKSTVLPAVAAPVPQMPAMNVQSPVPQATPPQPPAAWPPASGAQALREAEGASFEQLLLKALFSGDQLTEHTAAHEMAMRATFDGMNPVGNTRTMIRQIRDVLLRAEARALKKLAQRKQEEEPYPFAGRG